MGIEMLIKALLSVLKIDVNDFKTQMDEAKIKLQIAMDDINDLRYKINFIYDDIKRRGDGK